jgi:transposase
MKKYTIIFGVDVSKKTLDISYLCEAVSEHKKFSNDAPGIEDLKLWIKAFDSTVQNTLFCMETTGIYCFVLTQFLHKAKYDTWVEHAAQIKKSMALARGKNDKIDSKRIAQYAAKNIERLRLFVPASTTLEKIKHLAKTRDRIIDTQGRLSVPIAEFEDVGNNEMAKLLSKSIKKTLGALDADLKNIESQLLDLIMKDEDLSRKYLSATSVIGIGFVTAVNLIVHTQGFTQMTDVRKLACYCGVAPFEYSSGTSIKGKTKVHFMANKKLKSNLHMASLSAIKLDIDLKKYYERKVGEGKNKMSVLNAVRNKLLARVLACVNNDKMYVKKVA